MAEDPAPLYVLRGHESVVHSVCFSGRGNTHLLASDQAGTVRYWNLDSRRTTAYFHPDGDTPSLNVLELSDGRWLTQSKAGQLALWDAERVAGASGDVKFGRAPGDACVASVKSELHSFCKCEALDESTVVLPVGSGVEIGLWDTRARDGMGCAKFQPMHVDSASPSTGGGFETDGAGGVGPRGKTGTCMSLGLAREGRRLVGGYEDGSVQVWDLRNAGGGPEHAARPHTEPVFGVSGVELPRGKSGAEGRGIVASGGADGGLVVSSWKEGSLGAGGLDAAAGGGGLGNDGEGAGGRGCSWGDAVRLEMAGGGQKGVSSVHCRADGRIIAAGGWDARVHIFSCKKPRLLASLACHSKSVQCVRFSRDSSLLASASADTRLAVWSIYPPE